MPVLPALVNNPHRLLNAKSAKNDRQIATERRQRVIDYITDALTSPDCPLEANDLGHFRLIGGWFGGTELLNRLSAAHDERPQLREEVLLAVVVEALDRLLARS